MPVTKIILKNGVLFVDRELQIIQKEYITAWTENSKQHFDDGDYEWVCDFISQHASYAKRIVEIGCGAGYSTLVFALRDFEILSLDTNSEAISVTRALLEQNEYENVVSLVQADIVCQLDYIKEYISNNDKRTDLIVLCNPGGNLSSVITVDEYKLLTMFGFSAEEISSDYYNGGVHLLHKWAIIYGACELVISSDRALLIVERGSIEELKEEFGQIQDVGIFMMIIEKFEMHQLVA